MRIRETYLVGLCITLLGLAFQQYYLVYVNESSFFLFVAGALMTSAGIVFSFMASDKNSSMIKYTLLLVYLTYLSLMIMPFVRFRSLSGDDELFEFMAADSTIAHGWNTFASLNSWHADPSHIAYLSSVGITILPSIIHQTTGLDLVDVFKFILSAIISLTPILIYLDVKEIFASQKLAILSSIIFSEFYFSFSSVNIQGARQSIAILFVLFALFAVARLVGTNRNKKHFLLLVFSLFGILSNHYTITYLSIMLLSSFLIGVYLILKTRMLRNLLKIDVHTFAPNQLSLLTFSLVFFLVSSLTWFLSVPSSPFVIHLDNALRLLSPRTFPTFDIIANQYVFGSPLGPWVDNWLRLGMILCLLGFLFMILRRKDSKTFLWFIGSGVLFGLFLVVTFVPNVSTLYGSFLRVYITGFFFFCALAALALIEIDKKLKGILLIFLFLNLPVLMLLPVNQRYVLYHPEESVSPTDAVSQIYVTEAEFASSRWIRNYVPVEEPISSDYRGYVNLYYANHLGYRSVSETADYLFGSKYLWLHYFAVKFGLWFEKDATKEFNSSLLIAKSNVIYSDDNVLLMKP
jgi:uncharacterized membrane protein